MQKNTPPPFSSFYNASRFLLSHSYLPMTIMALALHGKFIFLACLIVFLIFSIMDTRFEYFWKNEAWFRQFIMIIYLGQIPFLINSLIFGGNVFLVIDSIAMFVVFFYFRTMLYELLQKYEIPD